MHGCVGVGRLLIQTGSLRCRERGPRGRGHLCWGIMPHPPWAAWTPQDVTARGRLSSLSEHPQTLVRTVTHTSSKPSSRLYNGRSKV